MVGWVVYAFLFDISFLGVFDLMNERSLCCQSVVCTIEAQISSKTTSRCSLTSVFARRQENRHADTQTDYLPNRSRPADYLPNRSRPSDTPPPGTPAGSTLFAIYIQLQYISRGRNGLR